ncbi:MAG: hypothetical protein RML46_12875 [Anaerolineae bacterium]|nr:hypothetical protein [Anaerolineae bacterium]
MPLFLIPGLVLLGLSLIEARPLLPIIYAVTSTVALWAVIEIVQHLMDWHLF